MADNNNMDDFWDLSELVPKKKQPKSAPSKHDTATVEIELPPNHNKCPSTPTQDSALSHEILSQGAKKELPLYTEYENLSPLIKKVCVYNWYKEYNYYDLFCKHAAYYQSIRARECPREYFFSYMPQYSQMNQKQLSWYLWWRYQVNCGIYNDTDYPYILLYIFELINLSTEDNAANTLDTLINLWSKYENTYPQLNKTLGEWICDFALIYKLPITFPDKRITKDMIASVSIPEVFYSFDTTDTVLLTKFLLSYCNSYNYRKSKFYDDSTSTLFETHIPAVFERILTQTDIKNKWLTNAAKQSSRVAFMGALCSYKTKKRIEVTYNQVALETELKIYISGIVKYAENKIRSAVGIRSRLNVKNIYPDVKQIVDLYFSSVFGRNSENVIKPEYEKLYDAVSEPLSVETAKEIESRSWEVTQKLVEAFEEETIAEPSHIQIFQEHAETKSESLPQDAPYLAFQSRISHHLDFFELIKIGDVSEQMRYIKANRIIAEAVVDEINEAAADIFGDILIEELDFGYQIIEDYKDIFIQ